MMFLMNVPVYLVSQKQACKYCIADLHFINIVILNVLQTTSIFKSYHLCSSKWRRCLASVCSTPGRSFVSTCRLAHNGRMTQWDFVEHSTATFKMTSCKCAPFCSLTHKCEKKTMRGDMHKARHVYLLFSQSNFYIKKRSGFAVIWLDLCLDK